jgi:hypothetical protein
MSEEEQELIPEGCVVECVDDIVTVAVTPSRGGVLACVKKWLTKIIRFFFRTKRGAPEVPPAEAQ